MGWDEGLSARDTSKQARLEVLDRLAILDSPEEQLFSDVAVLAAQICGTPMALVSLVAEDRQWFKAKVGVDVSETSLEVSFCKHAILGSRIMIVEDATEDKRFSENELVTGSFHLRFYAGVPVVADSTAVGTVCVLGNEARALTETQIGALDALGRQVSFILEQRLHFHEAVRQNEKLAAANERLSEMTKKLQHSSERFANLFEGLPAACMALDLEGRVMEWNAKSVETYGYEAWEAVLKPIADLIVPPESTSLVGADFEESLRLGGRREAKEWRVMRKDGTRIWVMSNSVPLQDPDGKNVGLLSCNIDITDRKNAEAALVKNSGLIQSQQKALQSLNRKLKKLSVTDGLTGLQNRRALEEFLSEAFEVGASQDQEISLILIDVDKFKDLNDEFGHPAGDAVLRQVAQVLKRGVRANSFVARFGGEEFAIVLLSTGATAVAKAAERLRLAIMSAEWTCKSITASFGVASCRAGASSVEELIELADQALYESKSSGRNRVTLSLNPISSSRAALIGVA